VNNCRPTVLVPDESDVVFRPKACGRHRRNRSRRIIGGLPNCRLVVRRVIPKIESETNGGRGVAGEYIRAQPGAGTNRAGRAHGGALAANHVARQEPRKAIPLLEQALERQPEREDLARKLRAAYLETGQHTRAAKLQKDHALDT
jgi:hypothetical protein